MLKQIKASEVCYGELFALYKEEKLNLFKLNFAGWKILQSGYDEDNKLTTNVTIAAVLNNGKVQYLDNSVFVWVNRKTLYCDIPPHTKFKFVGIKSDVVNTKGNRGYLNEVGNFISYADNTDVEVEVIS